MRLTLPPDSELGAGIVPEHSGIGGVFSQHRWENRVFIWAIVQYSGLQNGVRSV